MALSPLNDKYVALLAEEGNGAIETVLPDQEPLLVVLIGPIKTWWGRLDSVEYAEYSTWRDAVRVATIQAGHLVYSPHRAWQGAWHENAQIVNDAAILQSHAVIVLSPPDTVSVGTKAELVVAYENNKHVLFAPPADTSSLLTLIENLEAIRADKKN